MRKLVIAKIYYAQALIMKCHGIENVVDIRISFGGTGNYPRKRENLIGKYCYT